MPNFVQLILDLFEPAPSQKKPIAPSAKASAEPAESLSSVLMPAQFTHPHANRSTRLDQAHVAYEFKRSRRRTIGMQVGLDGLEVSAPRWVPLAEVEAALQEKASWIVRKLYEMQERNRQLEARRIVWSDGVVLPYLGEALQVELDPTASNLGLVDSSGKRMLLVGLRKDAAPEQIRDRVQAWLMRQAKIVFSERLHHYAPRLGVQWTRLSLSSAGTRWGSANANGAIRLNWRLIHLQLRVIDYVVAHELSHLRVMDHSPRFWNTVGSVVPDYSTLRKELNDEALPLWN